MDERHTFNVRPDLWPYGYAKYLAEMEVQKAVAQGQDCVIVNPSVVFGAGDINRQQSSVIMHVAQRKVPFIPEGGWNAVHISDVVDGHIAALERGKTGERYILGGENLTTLEAVRRIAAVVKAPLPSLVLPRWVILLMSGPMRLLDRFLDLPVSTSDLHLGGLYFYYDCRKVQEELGLGSPRPFDQAIAEAYAWFLANR
jgi:dihydroflavonol-4-reductase